MTKLMTGAALALCLTASAATAECRISNNPYDGNSSANPYSSCGNPWGQYSIHNPNGIYGSQYSADNPANPYGHGVPYGRQGGQSGATSGPYGSNPASGIYHNGQLDGPYR